MFCCARNYQGDCSNEQKEQELNSTLSFSPCWKHWQSSSPCLSLIDSCTPPIAWVYIWTAIFYIFTALHCSGVGNAQAMQVCHSPLARRALVPSRKESGSEHWYLSELPWLLKTSNIPRFTYVFFCFVLFVCCFLQLPRKAAQINRDSFLLFAGFQPVPVRQCAHAGQCFPQKTGGQEMAQHGKSELHEEIHQALERRTIHARDY